MAKAIASHLLIEEHGETVYLGITDPTSATHAREGRIGANIPGEINGK